VSLIKPAGEQLAVVQPCAHSFLGISRTVANDMWMSHTDRNVRNRVSSTKYQSV